MIDETILRDLCRAEGLDARVIAPLSGGQVNRVFLVDGQYVLRIGQREDAFARLEHETDLLRSLEGAVPVAKVFGFGAREGLVYQIQQYLPGEKLYTAWKNLTGAQQEALVEELAAHLKVLHARRGPFFGPAKAGGERRESWAAYLAAKFERTLGEIRALGLRTAPEMIELASEYFQQHSDALAGGEAALVHGDLTMTNVLVHQGRLSAILDLEYAQYAPPDYELWTMEAFCLYPNDYAEEGREVYCAADYARWFPLLQTYYPALFQAEQARERVNLYQIDAALGSYLAWRKDNLATIPPERMAARDFYSARITNFTFDRGIRMFTG